MQGKYFKNMDMIEKQGSGYQDNLPGVSVIILTYNGSKYIEALLQSLSDQAYPKEKVELIVVDNASDDNTLSLVRNNYPNVRSVALNRNLGFAAGNNEALKYAKNKYIALLNQDTICHKDWLMGLIIPLLEDSNIGASTSNMILPEAEEFCYFNKTRTISPLYFYDLSIFGYGRYRRKEGASIVYPKIVSGCSFAIRRQTIEELGYFFDEGIWMYTEDTDLSLRLYNLGYKVCAVRDSVVFHLHAVTESISFVHLATMARAIANRVYVFFKNMNGLEFIIFLPFLFFGGIFKIMELRLNTLQKVIFFIPFAIFSMSCMFVAIFFLPKRIADRREILKRRHLKDFEILKLLLIPNA